MGVWVLGELAVRGCGVCIQARYIVSVKFSLWMTMRRRKSSWGGLVGAIGAIEGSMKRDYRRREIFLIGWEWAVFVKGC